MTQQAILQDHILAALKDVDLSPQVINSSRRYWFVRTESGLYFEDFFFNDYIAISWNDIESIGSVEDRDNTIKLIEEKYKTSQPGLIYNQIRRFHEEMKVGDVVIIPSQSSDYLAFGEITSEVQIAEISEDDIANGFCPWTKRRSVQWNKQIRKSRIDPYLYQLLRSHHAISSADSYASYIDRTMSDFYIKGDVAHLILRVETTQKIPAVQFVNILSGLLDRVDCLASDGIEGISSNEIDAKISVQSPGVFEFLAGVGTIGVLALIIVGLFGGKAKYKNKSTSQEAEVSTGGLPFLLDKLMNCYERYQAQKRLNNKDMQELMHTLKIKDPSE